MTPIALVNGTVLTSIADDPPRSGIVLLCGNRINGVYESLEHAQDVVDERVSTIDVAGMTVLPGMIDCHVHLFFSGELDSVENTSVSITDAAERASRHLRAGVTTVRDMGAPVPAIYELRRNIQSELIEGPRVVAAGNVITSPGGHASFIGTEVRSRYELVESIKRIAGDGADCVKIIVGGGVSSASSDTDDVQFTEGDLRIAVETAHGVGLPVAAHASNPESIRICARARIDSIEHAVVIDDGALATLRQSDSVLVPTLVCGQKPPSFFEDSRIPHHIRKKISVLAPFHRPSIARAIKAGVAIAGGTDGGSTLTAHGLNALEARYLVECGLSNRQAIDAVTTNAASVVGLSDQIGTLEPGKLADILVVGGSPLADIAHLGDVRLVIKDGKIVHRQNAESGSRPPSHEATLLHEGRRDVSSG